MSPIIRIIPGSRASPVLLSVPHAGRHYPLDVLDRARLPQSALEVLEDRLVDQLVLTATAEGFETIAADVARATIDLNRDEREIDLSGVAGPWSGPTVASARIRGGLGLVPRRLAREGELWARPIPSAELHGWIARLHRPYHQAIADGLAHAVADHGVAVLIDCHSMPPLQRHHPPQVVFGTLGGRSTAPCFLRRALEAAERAGLRTAVNDPYAGGHTLDRHGRPALNRHALQVEIDRSLYLRADLRTLDPPGAYRCSRFLADLAHALEVEAVGHRWSEAAE